MREGILLQSCCNIPSFSNVPIDFSLLYKVTIFIFKMILMISHPILETLPFIAADKRRYQYNIFLISPDKRIYYSYIVFFYFLLRTHVVGTH